MQQKLYDYLNSVSEKIKLVDTNILSEIASVLINCKKNDHTIFTAGNGGSATTASHMVNDLMKGCRVHGREGFKAICLSDSNALVTCLANDFSYDEIYTIQLKTLAKKSDCLIVFSGSGNSPNVVKAAEYAKTIGMKIIGFLGRDGGKLKDLCNYTIIAKSNVMEEIEDVHLACEHALATTIASELSDMWDMEIIYRPNINQKFKVALFDFDGTLSLIREGWQDIMIPYFVEVIKAIPPKSIENEKDIFDCVTEFVFKLTGKQTIFQCIELAEQVKKRGGIPEDPKIYKAEYLKRLMLQIKERREGLLNKKINPKELLVAGSYELLQTLKDAGITLYLASGTDETDVIEEAKMLGLDYYFGKNIYGARDKYATNCTKETVINRILTENKISANELLSFGDGYVEIELIHNIKGYPIALATDEKRKKGIDDWKRKRLIAAGAGIVIPDFSETQKLIKFILNNS